MAKDTRPRPGTARPRPRSNFGIKVIAKVKAQLNYISRTVIFKLEWFVLLSLAENL